MKNQIELFIYNLVKDNPKLKNFIRDIYQNILSIKPVTSVESKYKITARENYFFGFHDKCPWSDDGKMLLAHRIITNNRVPLKNDEVEIGYFTDNNYETFHRISSTKAWNWTQGSMLQWVGKSNNIILNDYDQNNKEHYAKIIDTDGNVQKKLPKAIGAISAEGNLALSYCFERLRKGMPGYGYANGIDPDVDVRIPSRKSGGLHIINVDTLDSSELFTIADIASINPDKSMDGAFHYFTHCLFSPSGKRFVFLHRWLLNDNQRSTRMLSCSLNGRDLHVFPTTGMVSHIAWKDSTHILAYSRTSKYGDKYHLFQDKTNKYEVIGLDTLNSDGHMQFSPNRRYMLTDTYTDRFRQQYLMVYDKIDKKKHNIAKLHSPIHFRYKYASCDLHPRWNRDGKMVCFDAAYTGKRSLCTIHLGNKFV